MNPVDPIRLKSSNEPRGSISFLNRGSIGTKYSLDGLLIVLSFGVRRFLIRDFCLGRFRISSLYHWLLRS